MFGPEINTWGIAAIALDRASILLDLFGADDSRRPEASTKAHGVDRPRLEAFQCREPRMGTGRSEKSTSYRGDR